MVVYSEASWGQMSGLNGKKFRSYWWGAHILPVIAGRKRSEEERHIKKRDKTKSQCTGSVEQKQTGVYLGERG